MQATKETVQKRPHTALWIILCVVLLCAAGAALYFFSRAHAVVAVLRHDLTLERVAELPQRLTLRTQAVAVPGLFVRRHTYV